MLNPVSILRVVNRLAIICYTIKLKQSQIYCETQKNNSNAIYWQNSQTNNILSLPIESTELVSTDKNNQTSFHLLAFANILRPDGKYISLETTLGIQNDSVWYM